MYDCVSTSVTMMQMVLQGCYNLKIERKLSDSEEGILWLKNVLEKLGSPPFRQFHDMLLLSIVEYIESDIRHLQSMWYQV